MRETKGAESPRDHWPIQDGDRIFRLRIASSLADRTRAWQLAYQVYNGCGFVPDSPAQMTKSEYDILPATLVFMVESEEGKAIGSMSVIVDDEMGLPSDEIYFNENEALRNSGRRLCEFTRFVVDPQYDKSRAVLIHFYQFCFVYARAVAGCTDLMIEVNPRHAAYYRRLLKFEVAGPEKPCPRVENAPAVLLRLDLAVQKREVQLHGGTASDRSRQSSTLYASFQPFAQEPRMAAFIRRNSPIVQMRNLTIGILPPPMIGGRTIRAPIECFD